MIDSMSFPLAIRDMTMPDSRDAGSTLSSMGEDEFRLFYERTARPLWAYLSRLTGDSHKADDLLQETYYRFCRAAAQHSSEAHRRNSLFQIATNLVRDAARYGKHRVEVSLDEQTSAGHEPAADMPTPEQQVAAQSDLQRAMSLLHPSQRELLWLAYAQGASHEEIASILGLRAISVRTMLLRARKRLASLLESGGRR
jgi:RNA polymerase sigma-70 factor (ECF subfamily)